ncbi:MAG TPA: MBL fold metallo-hydrolase [Solirubrobacteraceae bacterium]|nr:MBL fold metallo-hydrolase [Solirubrobacteraceae bacterium]
MSTPSPALGEQTLLDRAAAAGVHRLALPTPFAVGRVSCWLIEDEPLTLVDTGPNSGKALDALERGLAHHGRRVEDLERIVLSHQHLDHIGLCDILARRSGAEVCSLAALAPWLARYGEEMEAGDAYAEAQMRRHGISADVTRALRAVARVARGWGSRAEVTRGLVDGEALAFAGCTLRVHHRPGHSPSDTILHDEQRGVLLGGDHLLRHISSNPLLSRPLDGDAGKERPRALLTYLDSMRATQAMEGVDVVLPGHGEPFDDAGALVEERFRMHARRADKILGLVSERPRTAYEVGQELWGEVALTQAYLCLSEVLGHVDLLVRDGRVREEEDAQGVVHLTAV